MGSDNQPPVIGRASRTAIGVDAPSVPSLAEAAKVRVDLNGPFNDKTGVDGIGPQRSFTLRYVGYGDRVWAGDFTMKVLSVKDTIQVGLVKARLAGGIPLADLDPNTAFTLEVVAHLTVAIVAAPPWAKDLLSIYDGNVLGAIYQEVTAHEARFRGAVLPGSGEVDGGGAGGPPLGAGAAPHEAAGVPQEGPGGLPPADP